MGYYKLPHQERLASERDWVLQTAPSREIVLLEIIFIEDMLKLFNNCTTLTDSPSLHVKRGGGRLRLRKNLIYSVMVIKCLCMPAGVNSQPDIGNVRSKTKITLKPLLSHLFFYRLVLL